MDDRDVAYIRENFTPLETACAGALRDYADTLRRIAFGELPRPSYMVGDVPYVPHDYFDTIVSEAVFVERYVAASAALGAQRSRETALEEWASFLSGLYGVCLHAATPENIARKGVLLERIATLLQAVDELDALERPFSPVYDRERFGRPPSRDTYVAGVRERTAQRNLASLGKGS